MCAAHGAIVCSGMRMPGQRKREMFVELLRAVDTVLLVALFAPLMACTAIIVIMVCLAALFSIIDLVRHRGGDLRECSRC